MNALIRLLFMAGLFSTIFQNVFAHEDFPALKTNCDLDSFAVPYVNNTYFVINQGFVTDLVFRGRSINRDPQASQHLLDKLSQDAQVSRSLVAASKIAWKSVCPGAWIPTSYPGEVCNPEGNICYCPNTGDTFDYIDCVIDLAAGCEALGCNLVPGQDGEQLCVCPLN